MKHTPVLPPVAAQMTLVLSHRKKPVQSSIAIRRSSTNSGVSITVYDKVESNPKDYNVMEADKTFTEGECDGFVSISGGTRRDESASLGRRPVFG